MEKIKTRTYRLDGDEVETVFKYDEEFGIWIEEYVDFESVPRFTPNGRRWRSVTTTDCIYSDPEFKDCGTCPYLCKEKSEDLIGVCFNERLRDNLVKTAVESEIKSINIQKGVEL